MGQTRPKPKQQVQDKGPKGKVVAGYDGTRLQLPSPARASSDHATTSAPKKAESEVSIVKQLLKEVATTGTLDFQNPSIQKLLQETQDDALREEHRMINAKKRAKRKADTIAKQIAHKEQTFQDCKQGMKILLKEEGQRHEEAVDKLNESTEEMPPTPKNKDAQTMKMEELQRMLRDTMTKCAQLEKENAQVIQHLQYAHQAGSAATPPMVTSPAQNILKGSIPPSAVQAGVQESQGGSIHGTPATPESPELIKDLTVMSPEIRPNPEIPEVGALNDLELSALTLKAANQAHMISLLSLMWTSFRNFAHKTLICFFATYAQWVQMNVSWFDRLPLFVQLN